MAQITPQIVKELREKTGAGMGDCKNALTESDGDMKAAIEILRKKGAASAAKRADRSAKEGLIIAKTTNNGKTATIIELNCETDFVAKNAEFDKYLNVVADAALCSKPTNLDELMNLKVDNDTIQDLHNGILSKFSEKIEIRRFEVLNTNGYIEAYIHAGSKLAVLLEVSIDNPSENAKTIIRDITMQIAAMNPMFIDRSCVSQETIDKEKEIYAQQAELEGKKPEIAEKVAIGRLEKFYQEQCLIEQTFVKDASKNIAALIAEIANEAGKEVSIISFRRFFLGESLD